MHFLLSKSLGGSIAKLAYRSNKDFKNGEPITKHPKEGYGYIRLKGFTQYKLDDVLNFIVENCDLTKGKEGIVEVHTTGISVNQYKEQVEKKLEAK